MDIVKKTSTHNTTPSSNRKISYIVLHYTAGVSSKAGSAASIANYFATTTREASADFVVDDATIVQYNPDPKNRYTWAVGGKKYTAGNMTTSQGGKFYSICTNSNSVSIEMCSRKTNTRTLNASDTDWYLTEETVNNAVELTKYLMNLYNIPVDRVIMHHHVTGKVCPNPWCVTESRLSQWNNFKARLTSNSTGTIKYQAHVQTYGWLPEVWDTDNDNAGTTGLAKRMEAIKITAPTINIKYRVHCQTYGWMDWKNSGEIAGTTGQGKRMEAIEITADKPIKYRAHIQTYGWTDWVTNGQTCGTTGQGKRMEAIEIKMA